jgi:glutamine phosphoribosylpyrophosphate amidotransferase
LFSLRVSPGADSVVYLSLEGLVKSVSSGRQTSPIKSSSQEKDCGCGVEQSDGSCVENGDHVTNGKRKEDDTSDSVDGITKSMAAVDLKGAGYCLACLNGDYPIAIDW